MATDEEVKEARLRVERLRQELANNERARADREREASNDITLMQLKAEEARLEAQLATQGNSSTEEAVRAGAQSPIAAAQTAMDRAALMQKAVAENLVPGEQGTVNQPTPTSPTAPVAPVAPTTTSTKKGGK